MNRIVQLVMLLLVSCSLLALAVPGTAAAKDVLVDGGVDCSGQAGRSAVCQEHDTTENPIPRTIGNIINIVTYIAGAAAVIVIIVGGIRYMTADGDSGKINSAKNTVLNTLIGITVIALSGALIKFVMHRIQ